MLKRRQAAFVRRHLGSPPATICTVAVLHIFKKQIAYADYLCKRFLKVTSVYALGVQDALVQLVVGHNARGFFPLPHLSWD